jgi:hypothetical protein
MSSRKVSPINQCGEKRTADAEGLQGMTTEQMRERVKELYPYLTKLNLLKRAELCDILDRSCDSMGGLVNKKNSCYFDSLFMALFHTNNPYTNKVILEATPKFDDPFLQEKALLIQSMLVKLTTAVLAGKLGYCSNLRQAFLDFDRRYRQTIGGIEMLEWDREQLEPADVIKLFYRVFNIPNDCKIRFQSFGIKKIRKKLITDEVRNVSVSEPYIPADALYGKSVVKLSDFVPVSEVTVEFDEDNLWEPEPGKVFSKHITLKTYMKTPMLIIHIGRLFGDEKLSTAVIPEERLQLPGMRYPLLLRSVLVHHDMNHYTSYVLCDDEWYHYNDLGYTELKHVGDFRTLLTMNRRFILRNASDFIYF